MTAQSDPYVRVYYRVVDDPKFADVFDHDGRLATWLRLLLLADATYPAPAPIPFGISRAAFGHLVSVQLVDLEPGNRFRIHGMDAERGARSRKAADAAAKRWQSVSNADASEPASQPDMHSAPLRSEPIHSEPNRSPAPADDGSEYPVLAWLSQQGVTIPPTGNGFHRRVVVLVERYGPEKVRQAMAGAMAAGAKGDRSIVFGAENLLDPPPTGKAAPQGKGFNPSSSEAWDAFGGKDVA
jgi:hypothetical protein